MYIGGIVRIVYEVNIFVERGLVERNMLWKGVERLSKPHAIPQLYGKQTRVVLSLVIRPSWSTAKFMHTQKLIWTIIPLIPVYKTAKNLLFL